MKKQLLRMVSILMVITLFTQIALAEDHVVTVNTFYESTKSFSVESNDYRNRTEGFIGKLSISGPGLKLLDSTDVQNPIYVVNTGSSVQFSLLNITDYINIRSDFAWKLADDGTSKIGMYDWKKKIGVGAIMVQKSDNGTVWTNVYSNTNVLADYNQNIKNFYSARRDDLNEGSYYRVIIAYKMTRKKEQKNFLFIDTSSWENSWKTEIYEFFIIADEAAATAENPNYSAINGDNGSSVGDVGAVFGNQTTANQIAGEEIFNSAAGHGYAAEAANIQSAAQKGILNGDTVEHTGANNAKNGSDYVITSKDGMTITQIQSKYYNTPSATLNACFDETGVFRYYADQGVPMVIEVPADQYDKVVILMKNKISQGLVPGVTDPAEAENIIRKGSITYKQAVNIAKAGNVDSLKYDAKNGCVSAATAFGITAVVIFATSIWNHDTVEVALQKSIYEGLRVGGNAFVTSVLAGQLTKTGLNSLLVPSSEAVIHALGPKASAVIINATRIGAKPIYGAAAMKSAAKMLRSNAITATISLVVFTVPDIVDIFRGRISGKQLLKNLATTAGGVGGGMAGAAGGAALGTLIFPGVGTTIGGIIGALGAGIGASMGIDALGNLIAEDDADEMLDIITTEFQNLAEEYLLNNNEATNVSEKLQEQLDAKALKDMYAAKNHNIYARNMVEKLINTEVKKRKAITLPTDEEMAEELIDVLEDIYDEADLEPVS